ncbi:hypothetical protein [Metabacillus fastidiosus]|uniref:hypothetical protein n=1 Tax=Metabacillus fastidiosus TaxID=1458 RepID=UPI000826BB50|nr:hypothetical protein [Metabacillus fastidiosus]
MKQNSNSGYTITGFSKSFFGYCSNWIFCDLGKGECFYNEKDPEAKFIKETEKAANLLLKHKN